MNPELRKAVLRELIDDVFIQFVQTENYDEALDLVTEKIWALVENTSVDIKRQLIKGLKKELDDVENSLGDN